MPTQRPAHPAVEAVTPAATPVLHPESICYGCTHREGQSCWVLRRLPEAAFREFPLTNCSQFNPEPPETTTPTTTATADDAAGTKETPA